MYFWLTIVVGFFIHATKTADAAFSDDTFQNEVNALKSFNHQMQKFSGLQMLLIEAKPYVDAVEKIDKTWSTNFYTEENKSWVEFSIELMKIREFTERFQCSQARLANAYTTFLTNAMNSIAEAENQKMVITVSKVVGEIVPKIMAVLDDLEIRPPKWMVMTSLFVYDVEKKANGSKDKFNNAVSSYLRDSAKRIILELTDFNGSCEDYLQDTNVAEVPINYQKIMNTLDGVINAMNSAVAPEWNLLNYTSFTYFDFKQWMLMEVVVHKDNLNVFMPEKSEELTISWNKLRTTIVSKFKDVVSYSALNNNWMLEMYESKISTQDSVQFLLRNVYVTVILKYLQIMITYCDNIRAQLIQNKIWNEKIGIDGWVDLCRSVTTLVSDAIQFLGEDKFLNMRLLKSLNTFVDKRGSNTSMIMVKVATMLDNLCGMLGILTSNVKPLPKTKIIRWSRTSLVRHFPKVKSAFDRAQMYTSNIKQKFPHVNFRVINIIMNPII